jgi:glycosyltransferase involved in cell wall biosynthesis
MSQDKARRKRILYVELSPGVGGAVINVLYPMVTGLDRNRYEPLVLFYWPNPYRAQLETAGITTMVFDNPMPWAHPAPVVQFQTNKVVRSVQRSNGRTSALYHALGSYVRLGYCIPQIVRLARLMREKEVDLVHINNSSVGNGRELVLAAKLAGVPVICYAQNFSQVQAADRHIARFVDRYVFCSDAIGAHYSARSRAISVKGCTIYPGVPNAEEWSRSYDASQLRREFGWAEGDFVAGSIGRLVPWKGQDVFLRAVAEVRREVPDVKGLVVGGPTDSPFYEQLLALTESLNLVDNVRFTGFRDDVPQIMASIDVLVHSSCEPEPFAAVAIEGMMAGRPVIATNAGGMPEMIEDGVTGLLVPPGDPEAMAQAILLCHRDRDRARQMATAGQQWATAELTAERHVEEFQALYHTLFA